MKPLVRKLGLVASDGKKLAAPSICKISAVNFFEAGKLSEQLELTQCM